MAIVKFGVVRDTKENVGNVVRLLHEARKAKKVVFDFDAENDEWEVSYEADE